MKIVKSWGMRLTALWLILTGIMGLVALPIPAIVMAILALAAGILLLIGM